MSRSLKSDEKDRRARELLSRIDQRRQALGLSENEVSQAGGNAYVIRDLRKKRSIPGSDKIKGIARKLGVSADWLLGLEDDAGPPPSAPVPHVIEAVPAGFKDVRRTFRAEPQDLPVYGTALGHNISFDEDGLAEIEVTIVEPTEVITRVARPPALIGNTDAYGFYVQGDSMAPAHKPGVLRVANPKIPPMIQDDVVVQLRAPIDDGQNGEEVVAVLIKTLVQRSASFIVLEQLNPPRRFQVPVDRIAAIHRVMEMDELLR